MLKNSIYTIAFKLKEYPVTLKNVLALLCICVLYNTSFADPEWLKIGLQGKSVTSIAAFERTAYAVSEGKIYQCIMWNNCREMVVNIDEITMISGAGDSELIAANSNGVYIGEINEADSIINFELIDSIDELTAMSVYGEKYDTLFVGNDSHVWQSIRDSNGDFNDFVGITKTETRCNAIHKFSGNGNVYVGTEQFMKVINSANQEVEKIPVKVSCIAEGKLPGDSLKLFVATDRELKYYSPDSGKWGVYNNLHFNEINDMEFGRVYNSEDYLYVGADDAVYEFNGDYWFDFAYWKAQLNTPVNCIALTDDFDSPIYAGTINGVFGMWNPLTIYPEDQNTTSRHTEIRIQNSAHTVCVSFFMETSGGVSFRVFDGKGRLIWHYSENNVPSGQYTLRKTLPANLNGSNIYVMHANAGGKRTVKKLVSTK